MHIRIVTGNVSLPMTSWRAKVEPAKALVIMGTVTGNVTAGEKVEIRATGSVTGDLAARFVVAEGGHLRGKVELPLTSSPVSSLT
jgi:cytoskeletal protein CcmA (bactofilin family)